MRSIVPLLLIAQVAMLVLGLSALAINSGNSNSPYTQFTASFKTVDVSNDRREGNLELRIKNVEDPDARAVGEVLIPWTVPKTGFNMICYADFTDVCLIKADLSVSNGWHQFKISDSYKTLAFVKSEDQGEGRVIITDASGTVLAQGNRSSDTGAITLHSTANQQEITIVPTDDGHWVVSTGNGCPPTMGVIYALLAGYNTVISERKATPI